MRRLLQKLAHVKAEDVKGYRAPYIQVFYLFIYLFGDKNSILMTMVFASILMSHSVIAQRL